NNIRRMFRRQAKSGPDDTYVLGRQWLSGLDRLDRVDGPPKSRIGLLALREAVVDRTERRPCGFAVIDKSFELIRLERKCRIRATIRPRKREVRFEEGATKPRSPDTGGRSGRVIGKAGDDAEGLSEMRDGSHVRLIY